MQTPSPSALNELLAHLATHPDDMADLKKDPVAYIDAFERANNVVFVSSHKALLSSAVYENKNIDFFSALGDGGPGSGAFHLNDDDDDGDEDDDEKILEEDDDEDDDDEKILEEDDDDDD